MKKSYFLVRSLFVSTLVVGVAQASMLLEPYVGENLTLKEKTTYSISGTSLDVTSKQKAGQIFGGRLGYSAGLVWVAADYAKSSFKVEDSYSLLSISLASNTAKVDETRIGLALGVNLPLIRFWGKYLVKVNWDYYNNYLTATNPGTEFKEKDSGKGYAVGIGYSLLPLVCLFTEVSQITMNKVDSLTADGLDVSSSVKQTIERKITNFIVGVSLPINLF